MATNSSVLAPVRRPEEIITGQPYCVCFVPRNGDGEISVVFCEARTPAKLMTENRKGKGERFLGSRMKAHFQLGSLPVKTDGDGHFHLNLEKLTLMNVPSIRVNRSSIFAVPRGLDQETLAAIAERLRHPAP